MALGVISELAGEPGDFHTATRTEVELRTVRDCSSPSRVGRRQRRHYLKKLLPKSCV